MRVVRAPDSLTGSAPAEGVVRALAEGVRYANPSIEAAARPMAGGGEGTERGAGGRSAR
ncbi:MAG: glycerate kinase [Microbacterium enclense]